MEIFFFHKKQNEYLVIFYFYWPKKIERIGSPIKKLLNQSTKYSMKYIQNLFQLSAHS